MEKIKRTLSLIMSVLLVFSALSITMFSATAVSLDNNDLNDSMRLDSFSFGNSNAIDNGLTNYKFINPVTHLTKVPNGYTGIFTEEDLNNVRNDLSKNYILMNNLDFSQYSCWLPIDDFSLVFDGNGYSISNLSIKDVESTTALGLFGDSNGATIKNLYLDNVNIESTQTSTIGGVAGDGNAINCGVSGTINSQAECLGGIIGNGKAESCYFSGNIENLSTGYYNQNVYIGGIVGIGTAFLCYNLGNISCKATDADGLSAVGGIAGHGVTVTQCYNMGSIIFKATGSSFEGTCGGIVGYLSGHISDSFNFGDLSSTSYYVAQVGGICGYSVQGGSIDDCYNVGELLAKSDKYPYAGRYEGGIIGLSVSGLKITDCYYVNTTQSVAGSGNVSSKVITKGVASFDINAFCYQSSFPGLDFESVWTMEGNENYLFPELINLPITYVEDQTYTQLYFEEPVTILNVGETHQLVVHSRDVSYVNGEPVYSNDRIVDNSEIAWDGYYDDNGIIKMSDDGRVTALKEGIEYVLIHSKNDINLGTSCRVFVGNPNEFSYTATYDNKQYYAEGGFFSEVSSVSDCVEIYTLLENKLADELKDLTSIGGDPYGEEARAKFKDIAPITLTATVSGNGLSFDRDLDVKTYTVMFDKLSVGKAVDDVLMLFPRNINIAPSGNTYTVTVTLRSDSFETITEQYTFTVENPETKNANEHISFVSENPDYRVSKKNIYGETMATLKNDAEYKWSKFSSFDFDNYYEVVFADILVELMNVNQMGHLSLLPVIKEWVGNYKTILSAVSEIVEEDNTTGIKIPDNAVDKLLKKSKYITDGMNVDDELRDLVLKKLHEKVSIDKINSAFAVVDKTQQFYSFFKLGINITNDIADYINSVSILNTYKEMNDDFKTVIKQLYNNIPDSEKKLKSAVNHYVNLDTSFGQSDEYFTEVISLSKDITLDVFKTVYKAQFSAALLKSVGSITIKGAALSSTAAFSSITTGLSSGTALGFCISDVLCNNSGKAAELGKTIAMSEFSPYVINTLNHYESKLYSERNDASVAEFENAFALHKATQSYIMEHTVKALETKRDSIIIKLFSRDDYDGLISDTLATKSSIDNLKCHYDINQGSTVTSRTKVIAIKCPVNVFVYDETGAEIVRIVNDITEYFAQGINVFVEDGKKYIALPTSQKYSLKIVATDEGAMEYIVTEYNDGVERLRTVKMNEIPLTDGKIFTGEIVESTEVESDSYALKIFGDANGDGRLSVIDATLIQKYSASIEEITGDKLEVSDVNKDGAVNVMDATEIQKYLADLPSVLV